MSRYELRLSGGPDTLASAVKASLRLVELGPPSISFPLLAATCRAVFGEADFALHLAGETGAFKSEVAALHQQHFGATMNRLHLPGAWSSTGNALEALAFHAKERCSLLTTSRRRAAALMSRGTMRRPTGCSAPPEIMLVAAGSTRPPSCGSQNRHAR